MHSRRRFLALTAALPFAGMVSRLDAQPPLIRYEVRTPGGLAALAKYAKAVAIMKGKPASDPLSWQFQWYIHGTPSNKATLISSTFPGCAPAAACALANAVWSTCQAHRAGDDPLQFLPWHRMYVAQFENIIRAALGDKTFALPYWDYTKNAVIPPEFTRQNDPAWGSLFNPRGNGVNNLPVNGGDPIDTTAYLLQLQNAALCEHDYQQIADVRGFCRNLDQDLHGTIHGDIGGQMGSVPTAGNDPIFWMHHCNIDRLWATWNANARPNPSDPAFLGKQFTFANSAGASTSLTVQNYLAIAPLNYRYDALASVPLKCRTFPRLELTRQLAYRIPKPLPLTRPIINITLPPPPGQPPLPELVRKLGGQRLTLMIKGLRSSAPVGTVFGVYLNMPENTPPRERLAFRVAQIHFFDMGHEGHDTKTPRFFRFDITEQMQAATKRAGAAARDLSLTFIPRGEVPANAQPVIEEVMIVPSRG